MHIFVALCNHFRVSWVTGNYSQISNIFSKFFRISLQKFLESHIRVATDLENRENRENWEKSGKLKLVMENQEKSGENIKK